MTNNVISWGVIWPVHKANTSCDDLLEILDALTTSSPKGPFRTVIAKHYVFLFHFVYRMLKIIMSGEGKAVPLQAWSSQECSGKLRFPDFVTTTQDGGKVVSLTHRPPLSPGNNLLLISVTGRVDPSAIVRSEVFYVTEISNDTRWDRTRDLPICSTAP